MESDENPEFGIIMERLRMRKAELTSHDAKENIDVSSTEESRKGSDSFTLTSTIATTTDNDVKSAEYEDSPGKFQPASKRRSQFDLLAEEDSQFSDQSPKPKTKESYMKGTSPRLSLGETRYSVLCSPAGQEKLRSPTKAVLSDVPRSTLNASPRKLSESYSEDRKLRFANPISATSTFETSSITEINESTVIAGSHGMRPSPVLERDIISDECGAHTFMRKKTPSKTESSSSLKICSPKPFVRGGSSSQFSPVQFNPTTTSSPKVLESSISYYSSITTEIDISGKERNPRNDFLDDIEKEAKKAMDTTPNKERYNCFIPSSPVTPNNKPSTNMSPIRCAAIENANARSIAQHLEQKLKGEGATIPTPKTSFASNLQKTPSTPHNEAYKTQWRGAAGTPVVVGKDPSEPTKPDAKATNLQSLKNRWEFCSATGTPIHPDESEDSLVKAAIKMKETAIPRKVGYKSNAPSRLTPLKYEEEVQERSESPVSKSPRYCSPRIVEQHHDSPLQREEPESAEEPEEEVIEDNVSDNELDHTKNASLLIDSAFDFIDHGRSAVNTPQREPPLASAENTPDYLLSAEPASSSRIEPASGSRLPYSISFYRKRAQAQRNADTINLSTVEPSAPPQQIIGGVNEDQEVALEERMQMLNQKMKIQLTQIQQASRALKHCQMKEEFRGSREEVDAQRALLVAYETRNAISEEVKRLESYETSSRHDNVLGSLSIRSIKVYLNREFTGSIQSGYSAASGMIYYFVILLRIREQVHATSIVSSDDCMRRKDHCIEFVNIFDFKNVNPDFECVMEIYCLKTMREQFSHEEKYHLKGTSGRKTLSRNSMQHSSGGPGAVVDSSFLNVGRSFITRKTISGEKLHVQNFSHPLDGLISVKLDKAAMTKVNLAYKGFLSMYQRTKEGTGAWNRYWCSLNNGVITFFKCPEDEINKPENWLVSLDLRTSDGDGASSIRETTPYPHSFHINVFVPREDDSSRSTSKLRVMLAADTNADMNLWINMINTTTRDLLMWQTSTPVR